MALPRQPNTNSRHAHRQAHTQLTRTQLRWVWCGVLLVVVLDGTFLAAVSGFYAWMLFTPIVVINVENSLALLPIPVLRVLLMVFPVLALAYWWCAVEIGVNSLRQGKLAFNATTPPHAVIVAPATWPGQAVGGLCQRQQPDPMLSKITKRSHALVEHWVQPFFSLDGKRFDEWFVLQEVLQIVSQTHQCYLLSWMVSTRWINQLAVVSTLINCLSTPMVRLVFVPTNLARQRLVAVLCDCLLSFVQSVVIPLIIFYPYYRAYDPNIQFFSSDLAYSDTWYSEAIHELEQIFITSYIDFVTTIVPHVSCLLSLRSVCSMLRGSEHEPNVVQVLPVLPSQEHASSCPAAPQRPSGKPTWGAWIHAVVSVVYGGGVLTCHLMASTSHGIAQSHCKAHQNVWFATNYTCSVVSINCFSHQLQGTSQELTAILAEFNTRSLGYISFSHCSGLEMPSSIQNFHKLEAVNIYNSTIVRWDEAAGLNADTHSHFLYVTMELVNMSSIPPGMRGPNLPPSFYDIEVFDSNLSALPVDIGINWPFIDALYLEFCQLRELPTSLGALPLVYLSLVGNHIEAIDNNLFVDRSFNMLYLSNNPLKELPQSLGSLDLMDFLMFENTHVQNVPAAVMQSVVDHAKHHDQAMFSGFGTPFCDDIVSRTSSSVEGEDAALVASFKQITCGQNLETSGGLYPINLASSEWPLNAW